MRHVIESVERGSAAYRHGLRAGDALISLNGEAIVDEIDYQALIAGSRVHAVVERDGREVAVDIRKQEGEPLGLHFGEDMGLSPRTCRNNCVFCFIRQMPPGLRKTLPLRRAYCGEDGENGEIVWVLKKKTDSASAESVF